MSEGRKAHIILIDDATLEILIQPKLYAAELLDLVSSHFGLKEREYFGLAFKDDTNHYQWLQLDRKVLEHEFIKKTGPLVLHFGIRFFIESIAYLRDSATVELFYCLAKQAIYKEQIECCSEVVFELAALALHETYGDYSDNETAKLHLLKLPVLPTGVLKEHPSITFCEEKVIEQYMKMVGRSRGNVIVQYMLIIESLPTYGIHYYEVKDKSGIPWWLGLSYKGIALYDNNDKKTPRRVFAWSQLENLYYREKKFSIEVHDPKRVVHTLSSFNLYEDAILEPLEDFDDLSDAISDPTTQVSVSRRTFGPGNVNVHAWFATTPQLTKSIWSMAVSQHQFYLDRKQTRSQSHVGRSIADIAADLCQTPPVFSTSNTPAVDSLRNISSSRCLSSSTALSTSSASVESGGVDAETKKAVQHELYVSLKARKEAIEDKLCYSLEKLKEICMQEAELTGELPGEYPLEPGETAPTVRKRIGTTFPLSPKIMNRDAEDRDEMSQLEIEYELKGKITKAAYNLIQENSDKNVRKTRQQAYQKDLEKLRTLEQKLIKCQKEVDKRNSIESKRLFSPLASPGPVCHPFYDCVDATSMPQLFRLKAAPTEMKRAYYGSDVNCAQAANTNEKKLHLVIGNPNNCIAAQPLQPKSAPSSPVRQFYARQHPLAGLASPIPNRHQKSLAPSNSVCVMPDSICSHAHQSNGALHRLQQQLSSRVPVHVASCTERDKNVYNLRTRQSNCYDSGDELNVLHSVDCGNKKHWVYANDSLCSLHKMYREQLVGSSAAAASVHSPHRFSYECPDLGGSRSASDHGSYRRVNTMLSYANGVYGSPHKSDDIFECDAGCKSMTASQHRFQSKSSSKDSAIHLASSMSSLSHTAVPFRCESLPFPLQPNSQFKRFQTPPFLAPCDGSPLSYDGMNLSHTEASPLPEQFAGNSPSKYQNFREVSKPFEMSDFYKYSERLRRQRHHEEGSQSPLCSSSSGSLPHISRSTGAIQGHGISSSYSSSIANSDQAASIEGMGHGCMSKEPNCTYHLQHTDLFRPQIHTVGSDSCIDYPSSRDSTSVCHPLDHGPCHSSPRVGSHAIRDSEIYLALDKNRSNIEPNEVSFGSFRAGDGIAEAFGEEMLAWFEKNEGLSQSPDGPSTLV